MLPSQHPKYLSPQTRAQSRNERTSLCRALVASVSARLFSFVRTAPPLLPHLHGWHQYICSCGGTALRQSVRLLPRYFVTAVFLRSSRRLFLSLQQPYGIYSATPCLTVRLSNTRYIYMYTEFRLAYRYTWYVYSDRILPVLVCDMNRWVGAQHKSSYIWYHRRAMPR